MILLSLRVIRRSGIENVGKNLARHSRLLGIAARNSRRSELSTLPTGSRYTVFMQASFIARYESRFTYSANFEFQLECASSRTA